MAQWEDDSYYSQRNTHGSSWAIAVLSVIILFLVGVIVIRPPQVMTGQPQTQVGVGGGPPLPESATVTPTATPTIVSPIPSTDVIQTR